MTFRIRENSLFKEKFFEIPYCQLARCGYLLGLLTFNHSFNDTNELCVEQDIYILLHQIYVQNEDLHEDDYDYLQYTHYENIFCDRRDSIVQLDQSEQPNQSEHSDRLDQSNHSNYSNYSYDQHLLNKYEDYTIPAKNIETIDTKWGCNRDYFYNVLNTIEDITQKLINTNELFQTEIIIAGDAALRKYCNYPKEWSDISNISIFLVNNRLGNEKRFNPDKLMYLIASYYPGGEIVYPKKYFENDLENHTENYLQYGIIRVYCHCFSSYGKILSNYDVDCLSMLYSITKKKYFATYSCQYSLVNKCNSLWICNKPKDGHENRNLQALHFGFNLRVPHYGKFIHRFIPDIHLYSNKTLIGSEYIYYYLLTDKLGPINNHYSTLNSWSYLDWYSLIVPQPKPRFKFGEVDSTENKICRSNSVESYFEPEKKLSYKDAILKEKKTSSPSLIISAPFMEFLPIEPYENGYSSSPRSNPNKHIPFSYSIDDIFKLLVKNYPVIITGGIISQILTIDTNFPYTIHLLIDKIAYRSVDNLLKYIHEFIVKSFNTSSFIENDTTICYSCKYILHLNKTPKTCEQALEFENFDFCRVGYRKEGFITDHIGQIALSNRLHFTTEDVDVPYHIFDIGFRTIVSKKFIVEKLIQRGYV